jgi:sulfide:quinone oxidoreductase
VLAPFNGEDPPRVPFDLTGVVHHRGALEAVDATRHQVLTTDGGSLGYDRLLVATGAHATEAIAGATLFRGPMSAGAVEGALSASRGRVILAPGAAAWTLPIYELALLAAGHLTDGQELVVVSPEPQPLDIFGPVASDAVARLLDRAGIEFIGNTVAERFAGGALVVRGGLRLHADAVIALPRLVGPRIGGLTVDAAGFTPIDEHARVDGMPDVFAAGDATAGPVKQGGLATQQADAAAEAIAAEAGAPIEPRP